jgi:AhpC/TSA family/Disulphide bond corrector protein DsbC
VELQGRAAELHTQGISIVAVSYDPVETLAKFATAKGITFPLLSDAGSSVIKQYRLLNDTHEPGTRTYGVPWPGTFMLDAQRRVTSRFFEERYQERSTASSTLVRQGSAGSGPGITVANPHLAVKGAVSDAVVAPGSRITLAFDVTPGRRIHVYAPGAEYQVVTVKIDPQPVLLAHETVYPASEIYFFEPLNEKVPVFQKPFRLTRDVTIAATREAQEALRGVETLSLTGALEYQACDDKVCFKPNAVPFTFELKVKALERP